MAAEELIEAKFRLHDGSDIGPTKYSSSTTVGSLKEKIISQWPKENGTATIRGPVTLDFHLQTVFEPCLNTRLLDFSRGAPSSFTAAETSNASAEYTFTSREQEAGAPQTPAFTTGLAAPQTPASTPVGTSGTSDRHGFGSLDPPSAGPRQATAYVF